MPGSRPPGTSKRGRLAEGGGGAGCSSSPSSTSSGRFKDSLVELDQRMMIECSSSNEVSYLFRLTMPESNCFCLLTTGGAPCALAIMGGRALTDDASISFCALCMMKSRKTNERESYGTERQIKLDGEKDIFNSSISSCSMRFCARCFSIFA